MAVDNKVSLNFLLGSHLFTAQKNLKEMGYSQIEIQYTEAKAKPYSILDIQLKDGVPWLTVSSRNVAQFLPSMFQRGDFLKRFLWIIQHIQNETSLKLDSSSEYYNPWTAPPEFIEWVSSWFNLDISSVDNIDKKRLLLANAIRLYRWRGTAYGMQTLLEAITGVCPIILENEFNDEAFWLDGESPTEAEIMDVDTKGAFFIVHFPVFANSLSEDMRRFINRIVQKEKPANTKAFVTYKKLETSSVERYIDDSTTVSPDSGIII